MIFVFIDTSVLVRVLTQARPGCELHYLQATLALMAEESINLVVPEIVELELQKNWRDLGKQIVQSIATLEADVTQVLKKQSWSEIEDVKSEILAILKTAKDNKQAKAAEYYKHVTDLLKHERVWRVPFTRDINFLARKRLIAGRMPNPSNQASNDAAIIESLLTLFAGRTSHDTLYFCSDNKKDFALKLDDEFVLHPLVAEGLPPTKFLTNLEELVRFYESKGTVLSAPAELIELALERSLVEYEPPGEICARLGCDGDTWWVGPLCKPHCASHLGRMEPDVRRNYISAVAKVLKCLTYREREVYKLRSGSGDGEIYTTEEVAHIFRMSTRQMKRLESGIRKKLRSAKYFKLIAPYFEGYVTKVAASPSKIEDTLANDDGSSAQLSK